ncbi:unnamed protein product [Leptosia nina]|uniref:Uncharacterized protein n=1 Tax=Leptosia nina TaxID=320188 RepID=A0AAV1JVM3_9NEOP
MRTVDPEQWHRKVKKAIRGRERLRFGSYQASQFEVRLRSSFADAMRELAKNSSVGGTELVRSAKKPARSIYCTLVTLTLTTAFLLIVVNITLFNRQPPLFVSQQLLQHPLLHVDFPAVALCSYTVITKTALDAYATRLANRDNNGTFTLPQIRDNLMAFGGLVTRTREPFDLHFMKFLSEVDQETNITNIMLKLSPDCEATLASLEDQTRVSKKAKAVGQEKGLMVVVKENTEDSAFMRSPSHDIEITLFDGLLYPLTEISGVHSYRARYNASVFFRLLFKAQDITRQMHYHSEEFVITVPTQLKAM